ncbi:MAG: hypothetical protein ACQETE_12630 [Bacteroidota bacterium]
MNNHFRYFKKIMGIFIWGLWPVVLVGQAIDYTAHPQLPVDYQHAEIQLQFQAATSIIKGDVTYRIAARQPRVDSLVMQAGRMDIHTVTLDDNDSEFQLRQDSLIIQLPEPIHYADQSTHRLEISYEARPIFGVHQTADTVRWTSLLPRSTMHWLPVLDHPRNHFTVAYQFDLPEGWISVANGEAPEGANRWTSEKPLAASELAWAVGKLASASTSVGVKKIRLFFPQASTETLNSQAILNTAYSNFKTVEEELGREFPFSSMNFVWLPDHRWETDVTAAGLGFVMGNIEPWDLQIKDQLLGQWFGVSLQMNQWAESQGMQWYRAHRLSRIADSIKLPRIQDVPETSHAGIYDQLRLDQTIRWTQWWSSDHDQHSTKQLRTFAVEQTSEKLANTYGSVFDWNDLSKLWYDTIGAPQLSPTTVPAWPRPDSITYLVRIQPDPTESSVSLQFEAQDSAYLELVNAEAIMYSFGERETKSFTFTGSRDSILLESEVAPDNVEIRVLDSLHNTIPVLKVSKPAGYWLTQLREGETEEARHAAARGLRQHLDEPDLQLALNDVLETEKSSLVISELISTLSRFQQGATGTADTFLSYVGSSNQDVQIAAVRALQHYPDNETVIFRLRSIIRGDHPLPVQKAALQSYRQVVDQETFSGFVQSTLERNAHPQVTRFALAEVFAAGDTTAGSMLASEHIRARYPYSVRAQALQLLMQYSPDAEGWSQRLQLLEQDSDPRIRLWVVRAARKVSIQNPSEIITRMRAREYDERLLWELAAE